MTEEIKFPCGHIDMYQWDLRRRYDKQQRVGVHRRDSCERCMRLENKQEMENLLNQLTHEELKGVVRAEYNLRIRRAMKGVLNK